MSVLKKKTMAVAVAALLSGAAYAGSTAVNGPMGFNPITASAYAQATTDTDILNSEPWVIPEGFTQSIVSDENDLNIYTAHDWNDMNTSNETGKQAGRYLYRTHEVRGANSARIAPNMFGQASGGSVSVVDLQTGEAKEIVGRADWEALDGVVWTPWQTVLFAEETFDSQVTDPDFPAAESGLVYELQLDEDDPTRMESVAVRPMLGSLSHEGLELDAEGNVYVIDEDRKGSIYKFVPTHYGDLSEGQLYVLKVADGAKTGSAEWIALDMNQAQISARIAAAAVGGTQFCRPEDLERLGNTLYAALTCEDVDNAANTSGTNAQGYSVGAVVAVDLGEKTAVKYVVASGKNTPFEKHSTQTTGFAKVDNLASGPDGKLWMVEDNDYSDIWVFDPNSEDADNDDYKDGVHLFASLKDKPAEGTGIYFGKDSHTLFVNVQHSITGNDKTVIITNREEKQLRKAK